jgi:hypothetical protein
MFLKLTTALVALTFSSVVLAQNELPKNDKNEQQHITSGQDSSRSGKLFDELAKLDAQLFEAAFISCDQKKYELFFTEDVEFYHDLAGAKFGSAVRTLGPCPKDKGLSRILDRASLQVFPVEGYGAIQSGNHSFVQKGSKTVEVAHFVHLWRRTDKGWHIARVLSFGHKQQ